MTININIDITDEWREYIQNKCSHSWNSETSECTLCGLECEHQINLKTGECNKKCGISYNWFTDNCKKFTNLDDDDKTTDKTTDEPRNLSGRLLIQLKKKQKLIGILLMDVED